MTKQTEALRMAIEVLEEGKDILEYEGMIPDGYQEAIQACKEALEQPTTEQSSLVQEPVYAIIVDRHIQYDINTGLLEIYNSKEEAEKNTFKGAKIKNIDISTNPAPSREWVGLSDEEYTEIRLSQERDDIRTSEMLRKVEAKLRIKNELFGNSR